MGHTNTYTRYSTQLVALAVAAVAATGCTKVNFETAPPAKNSAVSITPTPSGSVLPTPSVSAAPSVSPSASPSTSASPLPILSPSPLVSPSPSASACNPVASITRMTKILFVVDTSGSNAFKSRDLGTRICLSTDVDYASCTPPTDPSKAFRGGAIQTFLNQYRSKPNFQWNLITFAGTSAHSFIDVGADDQRPYISENPNDMQTAINTFYSVTDTGATPYKAAIKLVTRAITTDRDLNSPDNPQYFTILLTDGFPTDYGIPSAGFDLSGLTSDVQDMLAVAPGRVSLSTIYYGQVNDPNAMSLLQMLAKAGQGQYASVNNISTGIKIEDVIPGTSCP